MTIFEQPSANLPPPSSGGGEKMSDGLKEYRRMLVSTEGRAQEGFDRLVAYLSGGSFGLSLAFIKNFVTTDPATWQITAALHGAWISWTISLVVSLLSFVASRAAYVKAISQVDEGTIYDERPGGYWTGLAEIFTYTGGIAFIVGAVLILAFVIRNT